MMLSIRKISWSSNVFGHAFCGQNRKSSICSWCCKTIFGGNLDFLKIKKLKNVCLDVWTCTKMWKICYLRQNYALKLFFAFKMAYYCCFSLRRKSTFPPKKSFITSTTGNLVYLCLHWTIFSWMVDTEMHASQVLT